MKLKESQERAELLQKMLEGAIQANHELHREIIRKQNLEEDNKRVTDGLVIALELLIDSTADIPGFDIEASCPIAFKAARLALSKAKQPSYTNI